MTEIVNFELFEDLMRSDEIWRGGSTSMISDIANSLEENYVVIKGEIKTTLVVISVTSWSCIEF